MYFTILLDAVFGPREIFHEMECPVCGFDEIYYIDPKSKKQIGRACEKCNYVQKYDYENTNGDC